MNHGSCEFKGVQIDFEYEDPPNPLHCYISGIKVNGNVVPDWLHNAGIAAWEDEICDACINHVQRQRYDAELLEFEVYE